MKFLISFFIFVFAAFLFSGCDSATDSKSVSVNPPVLVKPYDHDSLVPRSTVFEWTGEADILYIDVTPAFTSAASYNVTGTTFTVPAPLNANSPYYWKAGKTVSGTTYWSINYYFFRTGP